MKEEGGGIPRNSGVPVPPAVVDSQPRPAPPHSRQVLPPIQALPLFPLRHSRDPPPGNISNPKLPAQALLLLFATSLFRTRFLPPSPPNPTSKMAPTVHEGPELETDVEYISTPAAVPSKFTGPDCGHPSTKVLYFTPFLELPPASATHCRLPFPNWPPIDLQSTSPSLN